MNESNIKGVSVRAIIVLVLLATFIVTLFTSYKSDVLNSLLTAAIGWYFGQKTSTTTTITTDSK
jgi:hypothetical protein